MREISLVAAHLPARMAVSHLHWGGGTPTVLDPDDLDCAMSVIRTHFDIGENAELAIECDPRTLAQDMVEVDAALARVEGQDKKRIVVVSPEGKPARTRFRRLQAWPDATYAEAELLTGRTHQIRAHARHIGAPLAGDSRYSANASQKFWRKRGLRRLFLHAHFLGLEAVDGERVEFTAPLPPELRTVLDGLG